MDDSPNETDGIDIETHVPDAGGENLSDSNRSIDCSKKKKFEHHFQQSWLGLYPWLLYDNSTGLMYCKTCKDAKKENPLTAGTNCIRT